MAGVAAKKAKSNTRVADQQYEIVGIDALKPHPDNPRQGDVGAIYESIQHNGFYGAIVAQRSSGRILAGNHRWKAAKEHEQQTVPVIWLDVDDDAARKILLADNRTNDLASYDDTKLAEILAGLADTVGLDGTGYDGDDLDQLISDLGGFGGETPDAPEAQLDRAEELREKWGVERGQLWEVGRHRILCGDSTNAEDVGRLMGGCSVSLVATSPPYDDLREYTIGAFDWTALMVEVFKNAAAVCPCGDMVYNLGPSHKDGCVNFYWSEWITYAETNGVPLFGMYVWDKGCGLPGEWNGRLAPSHEFVFHFRQSKRSAQKWLDTKALPKRGKKTFRQSDGSLKEATSPEKFGQSTKIPDSVIRISRASTAGSVASEHPAVFSVEFAAFLVQTWSAIGESVYEPFCGSGTTVCAAEQTGRVCYAMEIEPKYVAVTLQRLADMGLEPALTEEHATRTNE